MPRKRFYKRSDAPPKDYQKDFKISDPAKLIDGGYVFGWDPPSGTNFGWAVLQYKDGEGVYVASGLAKVPQGDDKRMKFIYDFIQELGSKYSPVIASLMERSIGFGWAPAREKLGENTGIIKYASSIIGAEVKPVHTTSMGDTFCKSGGMKREDKKTAIQNKAKEYFPVSLAAKKITKAGAFTHEADALAFAVGFFIANNIPIKIEKQEGVK